MDSARYEQFGGEETFAKLTKLFYQGVAQDPILKPMYPEEDLGPAERRLKLFLQQYWVGQTPTSKNAVIHDFACVTMSSKSTQRLGMPG